MAVAVVAAACPVAVAVAVVDRLLGYHLSPLSLILSPSPVKYVSQLPAGHQHGSISVVYCDNVSLCNVLAAVVFTLTSNIERT